MTYAMVGDKVWIRPHLLDGDNEPAVISAVDGDGIIVSKADGTSVRSPWTVPYYVHDAAHKRHDNLYPVWFPREDK